MNRIHDWRWQRLTCAAWITLALFGVSNRLLSYRRIAWIFPIDGSDPDERLAARVIAAVRMAARRIPGSTCLTQACAARALLALRGHSVTMRVGVRGHDGGSLVAHAWLLLGDRVILGGETDDFQDYRPIADFR